MITEVADDPVQRGRAHIVCGIGRRADEVDDSGTGTLGNLIELVFENKILFPRDAVHERDVLAGEIDHLQQGAHWSNTDPSSDEQHSRPSAPPARYRAVGPRRTPMCRPEPGRSAEYRHRA